MTFPDETLAVVVVTYNRSELLHKCLQALTQSHRKPDVVVVVDNASTDDTQAVVAQAAPWFTGSQFIARHLVDNTGGAGGFHEGTKTALDAGADWVFLMDDDVLVLPDAFDALGQWTSRFWCLQGQRVDEDGQPVRWKPYVHDRSWLPFKRSSNEFEADGATEVNSGIFEGMLLHKSVVAQVGLPDPRFFLVWDDALFAWLASRHQPVGFVQHPVLQRMPKTKTRPLADRTVNFSSRLYQYYVVRNRGLVAQYLRHHNAYYPVEFAAGTAYLAAKEVARIMMTTRDFTGITTVAQGWRDGLRLAAEPGFEPMPGYTPGADETGKPAS